MRGSKVIGGGGFGRFIRAVQTISRDHRRGTLASDLAPLEEQKRRIEMIVNQVDRWILHLQQYIHQYG
jgi:hypothetical protein